MHHKNLASRFNLSLELIWIEILPFIAQQHGFTLMELDRFRQLLRCTRGFPIQGRDGDNQDDTWFQRSTFLRRMEPLEEALFKTTVQLCIVYKQKKWSYSS